MGPDVEIVLLKQLASCLRIPIAVVAPDASVVYFNEPAESIFGLRFEETGGLEAEEWVAMLQPSDPDHVPLKDEERPLITALERRVPAHRRLQVRGGDGGWRVLEVTGIPLTAVGDRFLGALSVFWQPGSPVCDGSPAATIRGQQAVETILTRRLAETWTAPVFLVDPDGHLLYFNPAAAPVLGVSFEQADRLGSRAALYQAFRPRDARGNPIAPEEHPLAVARTRREPVHRVTWIRGLDGRDRQIAITAIPLVGQSDRLVGAFGVFWETEPA